MTRKQEDKLTMWVTTDGVLTKNEKIWSPLKAFGFAVTHFRAIKHELDPQAGIQRSKIIGITDDKLVARNRVITLVKQMNLNIKAFAMTQGNFSLEKQFTFTPSYYDRLRDNELPVVVNVTIAKATELVNALADFGIDDEAIQDLTLTLESYGKINILPRVSVVDRKTATVNIDDKFAEGSRQLEILDSLIGNFSKEAPDFVSAYQGARMIINLGGRSKKIIPPVTPPKQ